MSIINIFKTEIWLLLSDITVISFLIAMISCFCVEAFKITVVKVFVKSKFPSWLAWIVNLLIICLVTTILSVSIMQKDFLFVVIISIFAWSVSIIIYNFVIKLVFVSLEIIIIKTKNSRIISNIDYIQNSILLEKNELILNELIKKHQLIGIKDECDKIYI